MPENLPDHSHCLECEAAIPLGRPFCSDKCEKTYQDKVQRSKNRNLVFMLITAGVIISLGLFFMLV